VIINGKKLAQEIINSLTGKFEKVILTIVVVDGNKSILSFIKQKQKVAEKLGITLKVFEFSNSVSETDVIEKIKYLGAEKEVKGIIVQLPLPKHFNSFRILNSVPKEKDVDALSSNAELLPVSVEAVRFILEKYKIDLNKKIAIVGLGRLVGKPIYNWFSEKTNRNNISVIEIDTPVQNRNEIIENADILISGVGKANLISADIVKKGSVVIDFGYDFLQGKICGDVEKSASKKANLFTPTPGGTGPILVSMIFKNLFNLLK